MIQIWLKASSHYFGSIHYSQRRSSCTNIRYHYVIDNVEWIRKCVGVHWTYKELFFNVRGRYTCLHGTSFLFSYTCYIYLLPPSYPHCQPPYQLLHLYKCGCLSKNNVTFQLHLIQSLINMTLLAVLFGHSPLACCKWPWTTSNGSGGTMTSTILHFLTNIYFTALQ